LTHRVCKVKQDDEARKAPSMAVFLFQIWFVQRHVRYGGGVDMFPEVWQKDLDAGDGKMRASQGARVRPPCLKWVCELLERLPEKGDEIRFEGVAFVAGRVARNRVVEAELRLASRKRGGVGE
jgi:hypothetical protein